MVAHNLDLYPIDYKPENPFSPRHNLSKEFGEVSLFARRVGNFKGGFYLCIVRRHGKFAQTSF